ncbi:DUF1090 domain-containing protein [Utexia brackfieldae]|uniref:DUF1090 domain-containing protein n=1 Tax=Utexia brackfieldae TaxID=3074108 RepID=UPI00370D3A13
MNKAKLMVLPLVIAMGVGISSVALAGGNDCAAKRSAIENQIKEAQRYGNTAKVAGLKKALSETNAHCTNSGLIKDAEQKVTKLEKKLAEKQDDVREVQTDLRQAQAKGDVKKVAKYQKKLTEKQNDVKEVQADLNQARAELAALKS